ncbi:MAG: hypothetical protein ABSE64_13835 [Vulcanimicrobiaceae bacterium]
MHTGPRVTWEQSGSSSQETNTEEYARAATAYIAWPLAIFELTRRAPGSLWYRTHMRQAMVLGALVWFALFVVLALPLVLFVVLGGPPETLTIEIYAAALVIDIVVFSAAAFIVINCAIRASHGELFSVPLITRLSERLFLRRRG